VLVVTLHWSGPTASDLTAPNLQVLAFPSISTGGDSTEMISEGCPNASGKVLIKRVCENLLPTAHP
jgi:hypothetical protein